MQSQEKFPNGSAKESYEGKLCLLKISFEIPPFILKLLNDRK